MEKQEITVGKRIRHFRNLRNWSQLKLATEAGINTAFLGHLERGLKQPTIQTLEKITNALEITLPEFFEYKSNVTVINNKKAVQKVELALRNLPEKDAERIANIVCEMVKLRE
jgi:transcriptional regulator with XRE-family HTH domain|nr:MAG TPA: helix-turn-helix domain protein [Caudoviricetes sp.]